MMIGNSTPIRSTRIPDDLRRNARILFIAKHALGSGALHHEDGNHAIYHREVRDILEGLGLNLSVADSYAAMFDPPPVDFVFPLLNRGGFLNSEMLLPLLCTRLGVPFLGASPILRGLSDDKHLSKLEARARNVPTARWRVFRHGSPVDVSICPDASRWVVKPNASSASWGVKDATSHAEIAAAVAAIHSEGHDAIVEPFLTGSDVEVPVITINGQPKIMPMMQFLQRDPDHLRTYDEKRDLVSHAGKYSLTPFTNPAMARRITAMTEALIPVLWPFDYGRFEFRINEDNEDIHFLEVNLNCNLWSRKVFGQSAILAGMNQADLIETIVAESMIRHRIADRVAGVSQYEEQQDETRVRTAA